MKARYICKRCGLPVIGWLDGWKHASGSRNPKTPKHRQHKPEPIARTTVETDAADVVAMLKQRQETR